MYRQRGGYIMLKKYYDLIIVGAGPAGLMASKTAAELGLDVCVVEMKKNFDNLVRACSMQFILDDGYEGEWLKCESNKILFQKQNFEITYNGDYVPVKNKYYHSPKDHVIHFALPDEQPLALKFDKRKLLADLYEECKNVGVTFIMGTSATGGEDLGESVRLELVSGTAKSNIEGKKLIIAEGVNAHLSERFGLNEGRMHFATAYVVKYFLEGIENIEPNSWNLYYGRAFHCNSPAIIGPSLLGDSVFEMTLTGDSRLRPTTIFENLKNDSPLTSQLKDAKLLKKSGCTCKALSSLKTPYKGNVIAIGDTAAFVEVEVQGAFMCGYHAAYAVKDELQGIPGFEKYTEWWKNAFEFNSDEYLKVSQGYALVPTYSDDELDYLFGLIEDQVLEGTYSQYRTPKLIWDAILEHTERIQAEAPAIYSKMQKMNEMSLTDSLGK